MTNIDKNGIHYGYISSNEMDMELVDDLRFCHGQDLNYQEYERELQEKYGEDFDECIASEDYYNDEPTIEGEYEGVKYITSWLGGALNFFIIKSPVTGKYALCSPCVPGAGDLGTSSLDGVTTYDVPKDWRYNEA